MSQPIPFAEESNENLLQQNVDLQMKIRRIQNENQQHVREKSDLTNQINRLRSQNMSLNNRLSQIPQELRGISMKEHVVYKGKLKMVVNIIQGNMEIWMNGKLISTLSCSQMMIYQHIIKQGVSPIEFQSGEEGDYIFAEKNN